MTSPTEREAIARMRGRESKMWLHELQRYVEALEVHMDNGGLTGPNMVRDLIQMVRDLPDIADIVDPLRSSLTQAERERDEARERHATTEKDACMWAERHEAASKSAGELDVELFLCRGKRLAAESRSSALEARVKELEDQLKHIEGLNLDE